MSVRHPHLRIVQGDILDGASKEFDALKSPAGKDYPDRCRLHRHSRCVNGNQLRLGRGGGEKSEAFLKPCSPEDVPRVSRASNAVHPFRHFAWSHMSRGGWGGGNGPSSGCGWGGSRLAPPPPHPSLLRQVLAIAQSCGRVACVLFRPRVPPRCEACQRESLREKESPVVHAAHAKRDVRTPLVFVGGGSGRAGERYSRSPCRTSRTLHPAPCRRPNTVQPKRCYPTLSRPFLRPLALHAHDPRFPPPPAPRTLTPPHLHCHCHCHCH
jgi:hypothetical protein